MKSVTFIARIFISLLIAVSLISRVLRSNSCARISSAKKKEGMLEDTMSSFTDEVQLSTNSPAVESFQIISTQRGKRKLLFDGYIYRLDRSNDRGIEQWRCSKKSCRGRIHLHSSYLFSSTSNQTNITLVSSHSHAPEPAQCEAAIVVDHIRTNAQYNQHESPKEIIDRLLRSVSDETVANLPSITAMQRSIQRRRQQQKALDSFLMPTNQKEDSNAIQILYRSVNDHSSLQLTELAYNQMLILTCENEQTYRTKLSTTSIWLCTTFTDIKNDCLQCIVIIQIFDQETEIFVPLIYALFPSNTSSFYLKLFNEIFSIQSPKYLLTNVDSILIESLKIFFLDDIVPPQIKICSVFLHDELSRFLQQSKRTIDEMDHKTIKYLLALAYLPQADVTTAFESLEETCTASIEGVYDRFEDLCIGRLRSNGHRSQALFDRSLWNWFDVLSCFDNLLLINSDVKQWNELFRTSLLASTQRTLSRIIRTIEQLYQHQINRKTRPKKANKTNLILQNYYRNQFQEIVRSYSAVALENYLFNLIEYLPM